MNLLHLPVEDIAEFEENPRINDHAVEQMAAMIDRFGFRIPILVREAEVDVYDLVDGHLRLKAAMYLGLETVIALDVSDMPEEMVQAFRLSVNRAAELADWDGDLLLQQLAEIQEGDDELFRVLAMDEEFIDALEEDEVVITDEPGSPAVPRSQSADPDRVQPHERVSLSFSMTTENRDRINARLDELCVDYDVTSRSDALVRHLLAQAVQPQRRRRRT